MKINKLQVICLANLLLGLGILAYVLVGEQTVEHPPKVPWVNAPNERVAEKIEAPSPDEVWYQLMAQENGAASLRHLSVLTADADYRQRLHDLVAAYPKTHDRPLDFPPEENQRILAVIEALLHADPVVNELINEGDAIPLPLATTLTSLMSEQTVPIGVRDSALRLAVQSVAIQAGPLDVGDINQLLDVAAAQKDTSLAGTALLARAHLAIHRPKSFSSEMLEREIEQLLANTQSTESSRIIALRLIGEHGHIGLLPKVRSIARGNGAEAVRIEAISVLGRIGSYAIDLPWMLAQVPATPEEQRSLKMALSALKQKQNVETTESHE